MEVTVKDSKEIARIVTHCVLLMITDDKNTHQLEVIVTEIYNSDLNSYEYDAPVDSVAWLTKIPTDDKVREKILSTATMYAEDYIRKI